MNNSQVKENDINQKNQFWLDKWKKNEIGFHQAHGHKVFQEIYGHHFLSQTQTVFVPLCGKTKDIAWLLTQGAQIKGVELSNKAVEELFEELKLKPKIESQGKLKLYSSHKIEIWGGDFFDLNAEMLGTCSLVYDRAAYVALGLEDRKNYVQKLLELCQGAKLLLITFLYDQSKMTGPPFSITEDEISHHFSSCQNIKLLNQRKLNEFSELDSFDEQIYLLSL